MQVNRDLYNTIYNEERGFYPWKGKTFTQITTKILRNSGTLNNIYKATPLRLYRRENASNSESEICNPRTSLKIDELNRPNGSLISNDPNTIGIKNVLDIQLPNSLYDYPTPSCRSKSNCFSQENNALKRVRSSGMNRKKFNECTNSDIFNSNTAQYLKSRNKSFEKNNFNYEANHSHYNLNKNKFIKNTGIDSGSQINRVKYNTLTNVGSTFTSQQGDKIHNTLAYAVPKEGFIKKNGQPFPALCREKIDQCSHS